MDIHRLSLWYIHIKAYTYVQYVSLMHKKIHII